MSDRLLVVGRGVREQVLSRKLALSSHVKQVLVAPGNANTADGKKICNSAVLVSNPSILKQFCKDHNIGLVMVNTISLLTSGLIDELTEAGVRCFGPNSKASQLEANRSLAKEFMDQHGIPTARWKSFTNPHEACRFITYFTLDFPALVVKPSALGSARNVYVASDKDEACRAVQQLTQDWTSGTPAETFIVEERLEGEEFACLAFTDGSTFAPMPLVKIQDVHSELNQGSQTPVAEGLICPAKMDSETKLTKITDALKKEKWQYAGILGVKVIVTEQGPDILGFKCRFRDLDSQIILPQLKSDFYDVTQAAIGGKLGSCIPEWAQAKASVPVNALVQSSEYPENKEFKNEDQGPETSHTFPKTVTITKGLHIVTCGLVSSEDLARGLHGDSRKMFHHFEVNMSLYKDPVFVCTNNSAGCKIKVAQSCEEHSLVAQDLVAVCINDLLSQRAEPLVFMPLFACGKLPVATRQSVVDGLASACKLAKTTLLEREVVWDPDVYPEGCYSLTGFAVGVVERKIRLPRLDKIAEGDIVIGVQSSALHSNSIKLIKRIIEKRSDKYSTFLPVGNEDHTWGELLLTSMKMYSHSLLSVLQTGHVRACVPVNEGGLKGCILQVLPESLGCIIDALCWKIPTIFSWLYKEGGLLEEDMICSFNCGIGAVLIVQRNVAQQVLSEVQKQEDAWLIGALIPGHSDARRVQVRHLAEALKVNALQLWKNISLHKKSTNIRNVAVFFCTTGTKLQHLIDSTRMLGSLARVTLVISNQTGVEELKKAAGIGIPTRVIDQTFFSCHADFELAVSKVLEAFSIDLICLVDFKRTMSGPFLDKWKGKLLNTYRTLSPSYKVEGVVQAGAKVCGCTVCFTVESSAPGPMVLQETITVQTDDTEITLTERMQEAHQRVITKAVLLVASGTVSLDKDGRVCWKSET
ncbi:trifunctional purine biosynthetic adenosine-3 isoform X2 [Pelobates cultripes]|uniref:phosphoribosylformylglycinamidine cyclo-ligase n=1 Tax=Pelobates cultripes TaxID=61616 RepID=A0AAD1VLR1_PELCU|nr:trifunctional purine biosynthetic adenosine-3 isoform X2 [Pelobates cultripes]